LRKIVIIPALVLLAVLIVFFLAVPALVDGHLNQTRHPGPYQVSARAQALHARLLVADLHADSLVWGRDLLAYGTRGHVDVPRLIEGGVALQVFDVFTKTPWNLNIDRTEDRGDAVTLLALMQGWAPKTWTSLKERAVYQARRLHRMAALSGGRLRVVKRGADLAAYLDRRAHDPNIVAGLLALEGAHALEGDARNVAIMDQAGYRMIGLAHFFDNEVAGSAHGVSKGGLTPLGREVVGRMEERKILVDLAHASVQTIDDVLAMAKRPVVVSHTGVKGTCDNNRNLSDEQLRRIAGTGGIVGIGFWPTAICGDDAQAIARAIRHAVDVAGVDHVGLGSDFDGAVVTTFDAAGLPVLTEALLGEGFAEDEVARIMGGNVLRVLQQTLP